MAEDSILDQIIQNKQSQELNDFNPKALIESLFSGISDREKEVVSLRYGLNIPKKNTLEQIGKKFNVTRERIRQIENSALKKVKNHPDLESKLEFVERIIKAILEEHGGIMHHDFLIEKVLIVHGDSPENRLLTSFIINELLTSKLDYSEENEDVYPGLKLPTISFDEVIKEINYLVSLIEKNQEPLTMAGILKLAELENLTANKLHSYLVISKKVESNPFDEWGLNEWRTVNLKRMSDKVSLVLKKFGEPLHFTEIAKKINEIGFDNKKANPATIHNELILDEKYVLVGRGIYALKEWGYKPGVVADVIKQILKENGPLAKEEIIEKVLEKRKVKKSTVLLALMNKQGFVKQPDKKYTTTNY